MRDAQTDTTMAEKAVLTASQAAELLSATPDTVTRWARTGALPGRMVGGRWRFSRRAILRFIEEASG